MLAGKHGYEIVGKLIDTQKGKNGGEDENPLGIGVPVNLHRIPSERPWRRTDGVFMFVVAKRVELERRKFLKLGMVEIAEHIRKHRQWLKIPAIT